MSLTLATLLLLGAPAPDEDLVARIDAYLAPAVAADHLSGTVLLARDGEVLYERAFGLANREHGVANTPQTRHGIASITKSLTVAMAVRLLETGRLPIDGTLDTWLPDFPRGDRITVEHLLRHRAGLPHRVTEEVFEVIPRTAAEMAALTAAAVADEDAFLCEPGAESHYSSAGYSVLARVLELVGEDDYDGLLQELVCEPAGMAHTVHADGRALVPDRSQPYLLGSRGYVNAPPKDLSFLVGAGSVVSTAHDLHRFVEAVRTGALGPSVKGSLMQGGTFSSNGATSGFRAFADHDVASGVTLVVTANTPSGALDRLRQDLPRLAAGAEVPPMLRPTFEPVALDAEDLAPFCGHFEYRPGSRFHVRVEGGELFIGSYVLIPLGGNRFYSPQDDGFVIAGRNDSGRVTELDWGDTLMRRVEP